MTPESVPDLPGYHYEWQPDTAFRYGTKYTKCRQPRCPNPPVVEFDRYSFALRKSFPYAYCEDHLYGRRIANGVVLNRKVVKDDVEVTSDKARGR